MWEVRVSGPVDSFCGEREAMRKKEDEFFSQQLAVIEAHIACFPEDQREERVMEWIEEYAATYRENWRQKSARKSDSKRSRSGN
ncbi:MAG: hypothetical protein GY703_07595 [Gammaproteobacteria bacterium]|nr:hypothetical protein [Gammaproteobacteria bacterium]